MQAVELGPFDTIMDVMLDADGNPNGYGRPGGLHLGHIIKRLRSLRPESKDAPPNWQDGTAMYFGFLWEWAIELAFKAVGLLCLTCENQVRYTAKEGDFEVHMTMDRLDHAGEGQLGEFKSTWRTMKNVTGVQVRGKWVPAPLEECLETNFPDWMLQIRGYLKGASMLLGRPVTSAVLYVLFVNGDYTGTGPRIKVFELRFSEEEIQDTWETIVSVGRQIVQEQEVSK